MTLKIDHINTDRSEDAGFWYLWALEFRNTFNFLFIQKEKYWDKQSRNINIEPPPPSSLVIWCIYVQTFELYLKTYLLAIKAIPLSILASKKYGHDIEMLRKKCAETEPRFNDKCITWITQDLIRFTNIPWQYLKYPPKRLPLKLKPKHTESQHVPGLYGKEVMIPPLDLLDGIVKTLVYI